MLYALLLFCSLGDPVHEVRESAQSRLIELVERHPHVYGPAIGQWVRGCTCSETRRRAVRVLVVYDRHRLVSCQPVPGVWPICDAFPVANPVVPFGLVDVRDRGRWPREFPNDGKNGPCWTAYRATTANRVRLMLADGAELADVRQLLARMWALEKAAKHDCGRTSFP